MDKRTPKKKLLRIIGILTFVIIVGYFFFFAVFPFMLIGPPCSLYFIHNSGTENHTLTISVNDSTNKTILFQSYNIQPDQSISYNRGFGWYPIVTLTPFTWVEGNIPSMLSLMEILQRHIQRMYNIHKQYG